MLRFRLLALLAVATVAGALIAIVPSSAQSTCNPSAGCNPARIGAPSRSDKGVGLTYSVKGSAFSITKVVEPTFVKPNVVYPGGKIYWSGHPTFPITIHGYELNPAQIGCGTSGAPVVNRWCPPFKAKVITKPENPIVTPRAQYCTGSSAGYVFGNEIWMTDAKGHRSQVVRDLFYCET